MAPPASMTIVATDSGLGGMSVVAELVAGLRTSNQLERARVVFFNARPDMRGFNAMDPPRQVRVFDRALRCMHQRHQPDALLIACHTLCAVYPRTDFAHNPPVPVHGIVSLSARLIRERLQRQADHRAILLATPITHAAGIYARALDAEGVEAHRLVPIEAPRLAGEIERGIDRPRTRSLIDDVAQRTREAVDDPRRPHLLCLLCTHYPYAEAALRAAMRARGVNVADVLNPNAQMARDFLASLPANPPETPPPPRLEVCVESQVVHDAATKATIAPLLAERCPATAAALRDDRCVPGLFTLD